MTAGPARHDPLAPWRPSARTLLGLALLAGSLLLYPLCIDAALRLLGTRITAAGLLALALAGGALPSAAPGSRRIDLPRVAGFPAVLALLLALALATGEVRFLHVVPAMVYLWLALLCAASLREERSLVERAARFLQPRAPDFIGPYCRKVTALWSTVFFANTALIGALALVGADEARRAFSSFALWIPIAAISLLEYAVRKAWFRYYGGGPLDRLWALLLPAEHTERGRRSLAYIRAARARMRDEGFTPPGESSLHGS